MSGIHHLVELQDLFNKCICSLEAKFSCDSPDAGLEGAVLHRYETSLKEVAHDALKERNIVRKELG